MFRVVRIFINPEAFLYGTGVLCHSQWLIFDEMVKQCTIRLNSFHVLDDLRINTERNYDTTHRKKTTKKTTIIWTNKNFEVFMDNHNNVPVTLARLSSPSALTIYLITLFCLKFPNIKASPPWSVQNYLTLGTFVIASQLFNLAIFCPIWRDNTTAMLITTVIDTASKGVAIFCLILLTMHFLCFCVCLIALMRLKRLLQEGVKSVNECVMCCWAS